MKSIVVAILLASPTWASAQAGTAAPAPSPAIAAPARPARVPSTEVQGVVLMPDGKPAPKARVALLEATLPGEAPSAPLLAIADEGGAFRFDVRGINSFSLHAHLPPWALTTVPRLTGGRRVTLKLVAGAQLAGAVVDALTERPLAGAVVEASEWDASPFFEVDPGFGMIRTVTNAKGEFAVSGLAASGRIVIRAKLRNYATRTLTSVPPSGLRFRLERGRDFVGLIVDAAGAPVTKATVVLRPTTRSASDTVTVQSNAAGKFEALGLRETAYDATITREGFTPFLRDALGPDVRSLKVTLERPSRVTGRFVDEEDKPLGGIARVRSWQGVGPPAEVDRLVTAEVGPDGMFTLSALKTGANVVDLRAHGFPRIERKVEIVKPAETVALGNVRFERGRVIRGRAATADDLPVAGTRVTATRAVRVGPAPPEPFFAQAGEDGEFELKGLEQEAYQLAFSAEGFARQTLKAQPSPDRVSVVMRPVIPLSGRLVDGDGQPVARARLSAQKGADAFGSASAVSAADGKFTLDIGEGGDIQFSVAAEGFIPLARTIPIEGATDVGDIELSRGLKLKGVVVDASSTPVIGARVENQTTRQFPVTFTETDDKGRFELTGLSLGRARLVASHWQYSSGQAFVELKEGEEPEEAKIVLGAGGRVEGVVRQRDGAPVTRAVVGLWAQNMNDPLRPPSGGPTMTLTDEGGAFSFDHVVPGAMNVVLMTGQQGSYTNLDQTPIVVTDGETITANLTLRATTVRGQIIRKADSAAGLRVTLRGGAVMMMGSQMRIASATGEIPWHSAVSDAEGRFSLRVVGPLSGRVGVSHTDRPITLLTKPVEIPDVEEFQLPLDLVGARISGRVLDGALETAIADASVIFRLVSAEAPATRSWFTRSDGSGTIGIELEPGDYEVWVTAEGYKAAAPVKMTVTTSDQALSDVRLSRGGTVTGRATLGGQAVAQARVDASIRGTEVLQTRYSGPDGYFSISGLPDEGVRLVVSDGGGNAGMHLVSPGSSEPVEVKLGPAARLQVSLTGPRDAFPRTDIVIPQIDGFGHTAWTRADVNGAATLMALPGETTIRAISEGLEGEVVVRTEAGQTTNVTIELKPAKKPSR